MVPERFEEAARLFWHEDYKVHVHCTGDMGLELALDTLEKLQAEKPRFNHRWTIEHFGLSTPEQVRRMADLGDCLGHIHELSAIYAQDGIGTERRIIGAARQRNNIMRCTATTLWLRLPSIPLGWRQRAKTKKAKRSARMKSCRSNALKAITINAAYVLGLEIGTLRAGKRADFTVLEQDPFEVGAQGLKDIEIWGTVFGGTAHKIDMTLPLTILGGYLGAGKTTLINRLWPDITASA